jgi:hypothetical protein
MATQTRSKFDRLVVDTAACYREACAVGLRPALGGWQEAAMGRKLSVAGFRAESVKAAHSTPERIARLHEAVASGALPLTAKFVGRVVAFMRNVTCPEPPGGVDNSTVAVMRRSYEGIDGELAGAGFTIMEGVALAAHRAGEMFPDAFGKWPSVAAREAHCESVKTRLAALLVRIPVEFTADDLEDRQEGKGSPIVTTFRISRGVVEVAPRGDCAERLARWAAGREDL